MILRIQLLNGKLRGSLYAQARPQTSELRAPEQRRERDRAFDLLDALSRSGTLDLQVPPSPSHAVLDHAVHAGPRRSPRRDSSPRVFSTRSRLSPRPTASSPSRTTDTRLNTASSRPALFASRSVRRALLTPQAHPGSL